MQRSVGFEASAAPSYRGEWPDWWADGPTSGPRFHGESGNRLGLVPVEDLEVFLLQIAHGAVVRTANHHRHQHRIDVDFKLKRRVLRLFIFLRRQSHTPNEA